MTREELFQEIKSKKSFLCVGLDADLTKIPAHLLELEDPIFEFNKAIIEATSDLAVAYKPNIAFYECLGEKGWVSLRKTLEIIPENCFTIADAKRGDIGNTSRYYAKTFFEKYQFDSITIAPYMGSDSVKPFLEFKEKWAIVLALTSNEGAKDFQYITEDGKPVFQTVLEKSSSWGSEENMMYVVGATKAEKLKEVAKFGLNEKCGLLVNSSRGIIYADSGLEFKEAARASAIKLQSSMAKILEEAGIA
jgi:orotidine-5'-phosphate decarboxylase